MKYFLSANIATTTPMKSATFLSPKNLHTAVNVGLLSPTAVLTIVPTSISTIGRRIRPIARTPDALSSEFPSTPTSTLSSASTK